MCFPLPLAVGDCKLRLTQWSMDPHESLNPKHCASPSPHCGGLIPPSNTMGAPPSPRCGGLQPPLTQWSMDPHERLHPKLDPNPFSHFCTSKPNKAA